MKVDMKTWITLTTSACLPACLPVSRKNCVWYSGTLAQLIDGTMMTTVTYDRCDSVDKKVDISNSLFPRLENSVFIITIMYL